MKIAEQVSITLTEGEHKGKTFLVDVEEYLPYEPSAYVTDPGWNCAVEIKGKVTWFFVNHSGYVWLVPEDYGTPEQVGICPAQVEEAEKVEAAMNTGEDEGEFTGDHTEDISYKID